MMNEQNEFGFKRFESALQGALNHCKRKMLRREAVRQHGRSHMHTTKLLTLRARERDEVTTDTN